MSACAPPPAAQVDPVDAGVALEQLALVVHRQARSISVPRKRRLASNNRAEAAVVVAASAGGGQVRSWPKASIS